MILILDSFFTGSHKYWGEQLQKRLPFDVELLTLSGRFWKWRMEGGAIELAKKMQDDFISLEHLLLGILNSSDGVSQLLKDNGVNQKDLKAAITELRNGERVISSGQEDTYNSLEKYAINLNKKAKDGKLDPVVGRDEEIRRVLQIIKRKTKNIQGTPII